jgi:hypothetical protein
MSKIRQNKLLVIFHRVKAYLQNSGRVSKACLINHRDFGEPANEVKLKVNFPCAELVIVPLMCMGNWRYVKGKGTVHPRTDREDKEVD